MDDWVQVVYLVVYVVVVLAWLHYKKMTYVSPSCHACMGMTLLLCIFLSEGYVEVFSLSSFP